MVSLYVFLCMYTVFIGVYERCDPCYNYPILTHLGVYYNGYIRVNSPQKNPLKNTKWEKNPQIGEKKMISNQENNEIKQQMDVVISELEKLGVSASSHSNNTEGLGDVVENVLKSVGITEERFKQWFGLRECNCSKRKAWLNNLFSWKKNQTQG
jgi:hypothetical protein